MGVFFIDVVVLLLYNICVMKAHIHLVIEADLKARLEQLAEKDKRSLNNLINVALEEYANKGKVRGFNPQTDVGFMLLNKGNDDAPREK